MPAIAIDISQTGLRPCIVTHKIKSKPVEKKAIFHTWAANYGPGAIAIVEYEDGSIAQVAPKCLRFIDSSIYFNQFYWEEDPCQEESQKIQSNALTAETSSSQNQFTTFKHALADQYQSMEATSISGDALSRE